MSESERPSTSNATTKRRRSVRILRWIGISVGCLLLLAGGAMWIARSSWFIVAWITPELEQRFGGDVSINKAVYTGDGQFLMEGFSLRTHTDLGLASEVMTVGQALIDLDSSALMEGSIVIQNVELQDLVIRLGENQSAPGVFNFAHLMPDWPATDDDASMFLPPRVFIRTATLEFGSYSQGEYTLQGSRQVRGRMFPVTLDEQQNKIDGGTGDESRWYAFELYEVDDRSERVDKGVQISGQCDVLNNEWQGTLSGFSLDRDMYDMFPEIARVWWDRMKLAGRIDSAQLWLDRQSQLEVELRVDDVALTLPLPADTRDVWSRYSNGVVSPSEGDPRMHGTSGVIRLARDKIELRDLTGTLGSSDGGGSVMPVPYTVNMSIYDLPAWNWSDREQWINAVLEEAPFSLSFVSSNFALRGNGDSDPAIDLPAPIARALARFSMKDIALSTEISVERRPTDPDDPAASPQNRLRTFGQTYITDANGAYEKFPYLIESITAFLQFENDRVIVQYINGRGAGDAKVRVTGEVMNPGKEAEVNLKLVATDVPLDDRLRAALKPAHVRIVDSLLDQRAEDSLREAGLLDVLLNKDAVDEKRRALFNRLAELQKLDPPDVQAIARVESQLESMRELSELVPFEVGGTVDLDLNIRRPPGLGMRTQTTGLVSIGSAGLLYAGFPYPAFLTGGTLDWQPDRISIVETEATPGITVLTAGGGRGAITGELVFERSEKGEPLQLKPDLSVRIFNDKFTTLQLAAIPLAKSTPADPMDVQDWPGERRSKIAELLTGIGLDGMIDYHGDIVSGPDGQPAFDFVIKLADGTAVPHEALSQAIGRAGLLWPAAFELHDVNGIVHVTQEKIQVVSIDGQHPGGGVHAEGIIHTTRDNTSRHITLTMSDLPLGDYLINLAPRDGLERARKLWDTYQPTGSFDANLSFRAEHGGDLKAELQVKPDHFTAAVRGVPILLQHVRGDITVRDDQVRLNELHMDLFNGEEPEGQLVFSGSYGVSAKGDGLQVDGSWLDGRFESPVIPEILTLIDAQGQADQYMTYLPSGRFDTNIFYRSPQGDRPRDYRITLEPKSIALTFNETPIFASLDAGSKIVFSPNLVDVVNFTGSNSGGTFSINGTVETYERVTETTLAFDYSGSLLSSQVQAFLPEQARSAIKAIELDDGQANRLRDGHLHMVAARPEGADETSWTVDFNSIVETRSAFVSAGVDFSEVEGAFDIRFSSAPEAPASLVIDADIASANTLGHKLTEAVARLEYDGRTKRADISGIRAKLYGGIVSGEASVRLESGGAYAGTIELAGVMLEEAFRRDDVLADGEAEGSDDHPSGQLFASMHLSGNKDTSASRVGRGSVRVIGGRMADIPVTLQLVQLLQLTLPMTSSLDYADVDYFVDGDTVVFDHILLESTVGENAPLQLLGEGHMDFNTLELDTRFRSRGGIALIRDIFGGIGDQLYVIQVKGSLKDPEASILPLPGLSEKLQRPNQTAAITNGAPLAAP